MSLKATLFAWLLVAGCVTDIDDTNLETSETTQDLYVAASQIWPAPEIPVCWETAGRDSDKAIVRDAVRTTWEAEANVTFTGWGTCNSSTSSGIRIRTADMWPSTFSLGKSLNNLVNGMTINFDFMFRDVLGNQPFSACIGGMRTQCIRNSAVHEFGHALGFAHEQDRGDTPSTCHVVGALINGDTTVGPWDLNSIMNYCNPQNAPTTLSVNDIWGVQKFYGTHRPISATLRSWGQHDLAVRSVDDFMQTVSYDGGSTSWQTTNQGIITGAPTIVATSPTDVFAVAHGTDRALYVKRGQNGAWSGWSGIGGFTVGSPVAVSRGAGLVDVFVRSADDGSLQRRAFFGGAWSSGFESVGVGTIPPIVGSPAVIALGSTNLAVVARGRDNLLYSTRWNGTWDSWTVLGTQQFASDPAVGTRDGFALDIFARGTDDALWTMTRYASKRTGWTQLGSNPFLGTPAVVSRAPGLLDVFIRGTDRALYTKWFDGTSWLPFYVQLASNPIAASPTATSSSSGRIDVFVRGTDDRLYDMRWLGAGWLGYQQLTASASFK